MKLVEKFTIKHRNNIHIIITVTIKFSIISVTTSGFRHDTWAKKIAGLNPNNTRFQIIIMGGAKKK